jgi:hypothetical protein
LAGECVRPQGKLWIFADQGQAFWPDRLLDSEMVRGFPKCKLKKPYRKLLRKSINEDVVRIVTCSEMRLRKQIGKEINRLLNNGLEPGDIVVLSLRGMQSEEGIVH